MRQGKNRQNEMGELFNPSLIIQSRTRYSQQNNNKMTIYVSVGPTFTYQSASFPQNVLICLDYLCNSDSKKHLQGFWNMTLPI